MPRSRLLASLLASILIASTSHSEDWLTYQHDPTRVGATMEDLSPDLTLRWVHSSAVLPETAWEGPRGTPIEGHIMKHRVRFDDAHHVAVAGNRAFFGSSVDQQLYCVDLATGKPIWKFFTDGPLRLAPTLHDGRVYFGSDDGCVYCLEATSGKVVWQHRVGPKDERILARGKMISRWPVRTGVLIDNGVAYFGAGIFPHETVYLCAANAATGKLLWKNDRISQQNAGRNDLSPQGYLLANKEKLFVPSGRTLPAAFDRESGKFVFKKSYGWRSTAGGVIGGSKAMLADGQLFSSGAHHFIALSQKTGSAGFAFMLGRQMTFRGDLAYIATGKHVIAVNRDEHAKASVERQKLFVKRRSFRSDRKKLAEIDQQMAELAKGGMLWSQPFAGDSALILTKDLVIAGGSGTVAAYNVDDGQLAWSHKVLGDARGLAAANGSLLVSTTAGKIYAFSDRKPAAKEDDVKSYPIVLSKSPFPKDNLTALYEQAAEQIIRLSGEKKGFCLVLGSEHGRLAYELAKRTEMTIYGVEPDKAKVQASREALSKAGLYGHRVSIVHGTPAKTPFSNYFANLVVSDSMLMTGKLPAVAVELGRYVKPCGGVACFGAPKESAAAQNLDSGKLKLALAEMYLRDDAEIRADGSWAILNRGKLADVGDWSHQYGNVGNTCFSEDHRLKGSLGVLWYGDPGPNNMINRHEAAAAPLSTNGRFFIQGMDNVRAYDAYNGQYLWEHKNPGAIRTGVFNNNETANLAASDDALFVAVNDTCSQLDAATGEVQHTYRAEQSDDGVPRAWGYVAYHKGLLYGTSTIRSELARELRRRGRTVNSTTDAIFAMDTKSGKRQWIYRGKNIMHVTIAIGGGKVYFIESTISPEERDALLRQDKTELEKLTGEAREKKERELKSLDVRRAVALDAKTGKELWRKAIDVTSVSGISAGGGNLALMYHDGHVAICGANANGHYWRQFLSGEFSKRRIVVLDSKSGEKLWSKDANYMNRPAIINDMVLAEPWAFDLHTGKEKTRTHPLTGLETNWQFSRPGHHCGIVTATPNMMFFRSGFIGYYDLYADSGTRHFAGQRLGCWINAIPGNGLLMIPEASAGCVCLFSITSTVVLEPREDRTAAWGIYSAAGKRTPVKHLALNLGAPGDRRDEFGTLWLGYPRPASRGRMEYVFDVKPQIASGGGYYVWNEESVNVAEADTPWVFTSGAHGLTRCELPLLGKDDGPAKFTVKLYFADLAENKTSSGNFDIKLQGQSVAEDVEIESAAGGKNRAFIKQFKGVEVKDNLIIELIGKKGLASIAGIEVIRE